MSEIPLLTRGPAHPDMYVDVYVLGRSPTSRDFDNKTAFVSGGKSLVDFLGYAGVEQECVRFGYTVPEWSPKAPSKKTVEFYREAVENDIAQSKPKVIVFVGHGPLFWLLGVPSILPLSWRGRFWPVTIQGHSCWGLSVLDPAYIVKTFGKNAKSVQEYNTLTVNDLAQINDLISQPPFLRDVSADIELCEKGAYTDFEEALCALESFPSGVVVSTDIETNGLEPWNGQELLMFSISHKKHVVTVPLEHPEAAFTNEQKEKLFAAYIDLLLRSSDVVAHNTLFELRWLCHRDSQRLLKGPMWHDTMAMAYLLDSRSGCLNLDFQAIFRWGVQLKSLTGIDRTNIINEPLFESLVYNGMDALYTYDLFEELMDDLVEEDLLGPYEKHMDRTLSITEMTQAGVPLSQEEIMRQQEESEQEEKRLLEKLNRNPDVIKYVTEKKKDFNPLSSSMVSSFFKTLYPSKKLMNKAAKVSVDKEVLERLNHPAADLIKRYRSIHTNGVNLKNWSDPDLTDVRDGWLYLHGHFSHTVAATGRLSSSNPNLQNGKKGTSFRNIVCAPPGYKLVDVDYRQLEACGIAAVSEDAFFIDALTNGLDVHAKCTEDLLEIWPEFGKGKEFSALRSIVKNVWVFPAFYGAHWKSLAVYTGLPEKVAQAYYDKFWLRFKGVKRWQQQMLKFYKTYGYIKGPTGRIYREPLRTNQILNFPIQGSCSDLLVEGMGTLCRLGLVPRLNVHDELLFCVRDSQVESSIELIQDVLLNPSSDFDWLTTKIPLGCKISLGTHWGKLKTVVDTTKQ